MNFWKSLAGGLLGGGIGAVLWVIVARLTGYHVGFVAWGVGFLAGLGVMIGSRAQGGVGYGLLASAIALVCIMGGKYAEASLEVERMAAEHAHVDESNAVEYLRAVISDEMNEAGTLSDADWERMGEDDAWPSRVQEAAEARWAAMGETERAAFIERRAGENAAQANEYRGVATFVLFLVSFGLWGFLWTGLAVASAYKLGSAKHSPAAGVESSSLSVGPVTVTETRREVSRVIPVIPGREGEAVEEVRTLVTQAARRPRFTMTGEVMPEEPGGEGGGANGQREAA